MSLLLKAENTDSIITEIKKLIKLNILANACPKFKCLWRKLNQAQQRWTTSDETLEAFFG